MKSKSKFKNDIKLSKATVESGYLFGRKIEVMNDIDCIEDILSHSFL
jgi:hypothetical protein